MTLENLLETGQLKEHTATIEEVSRLIKAARRNLADLGGYVDQAAVEACIAEAGGVLKKVETWIRSHRPDLMP